MSRKKILYGLLEVNVLSLLILFYFYTFSVSPAQLLQASPHPFIIISAIIGIRYGNYMGITAATFCAIYYALVFQNQVGPAVLILGEFQFYKYILAIYWAAIILGIFKDNYDAVTQRLNNRIILQEAGLERLGRKYEESIAVNNDLKKQIIGAEYSILSLYEIASNLDSLDPESVYTDTMGILKKFINAVTVSIYTVDKKNSDLLRLKLRMGEVFGDDVRTIDILHSDGFTRVVKKKETLKWNDTDDQTFPLMVAPIEHEGEVIAIINIEDMDFDVLSEYAFNLFKVIVEWVSKSIGQAIYVDQQLREEKYLGETNFLKYAEFLVRLEQEQRRQDEFDLEFLHLRYNLNESKFEDLQESLTRFLRSVDVFSYEIDTNIVHILLPATPPAAFEMINERVMMNLEYNVTLVQSQG